MKTENEASKVNDGSVSADNEYDWSISLDKSLSASLDSLDNLFCRRCLVHILTCYRICYLLLY